MRINPVVVVVVVVVIVVVLRVAVSVQFCLHSLAFIYTVLVVVCCMGKFLCSHMPTAKLVFVRSCVNNVKLTSCTQKCVVI